MVDLESLERLISANDYPHLVSQVDVDNIRSIVNAHPSLFEKSWDERGSKRRDSGAVFIREYIQDPLNGLKDVDIKNLYGFFFTATAQVGQYQSYGDSYVHRNPILNYFLGNRVLVFDADNPTEVYEEHIDFETFPMFSASRKYICEFVSALTGNQDTSSLESILDKIDSLDPSTEDDFDFSLNYLVHKKYNNSVELHLYKSSNDDTGVEDIIADVAGSKRTKFFNNSKSSVTCMGDNYTDDNTNVLIDITFGQEGLEKNFGQSMMPMKKRNAPTGTLSTDNMQQYNEYRNNHNSSMVRMSDNLDNYQWLPEGWKKELQTWEDCRWTENVFATFKVNAKHEGNTFRLAYGFVGKKNGNEPS